MGTREKILVGLMIAAMIYGAFELLVVSPENSAQKKTSGTGLESARQMAEKINTRIAQSDLDNRQTYILKLAGLPWQRDPFYVLPDSRMPSAGRASGAAAPEDLNYTGFLAVGKTRMAIINGVEYRVGQRLENGRGVIRRISPDRVVIESGHNGRSISIPYEQ